MNPLKSKKTVGIFHILVIKWVREVLEDVDYNASVGFVN